MPGHEDVPSAEVWSRLCTLGVAAVGNFILAYHQLQSLQTTDILFSYEKLKERKEEGAIITSWSWGLRARSSQTKWQGHLVEFQAPGSVSLGKSITLRALPA